MYPRQLTKDEFCAANAIARPTSFTPDWAVNKCIDRGPGMYYRYSIEGRNDNDGCAFRWDVPDLDQRFYWSPDAAECPRYDWDVSRETGLPTSGAGSTHVFARIVRRHLERYCETIVQIETSFGRYSITQWFEHGERMLERDKFSVIGRSNMPTEIARNLFDECLRLEKAAAQ